MHVTQALVWFTSKQESLVATPGSTLFPSAPAAAQVLVAVTAPSLLGDATPPAVYLSLPFCLDGMLMVAQVGWLGLVEGPQLAASTHDACLHIAATRPWTVFLMMPFRLYRRRAPTLPPGLAALQPTWLFGSAAGPISQLGVAAGVLQAS